MKVFYDVWGYIKDFIGAYFDLLLNNFKKFGLFAIFIDLFILLMTYGLLYVLKEIVKMFLNIGAERRVGEEYEKYVAKKLSKIGKVYRNIIVPSQDTPIGKTEADMVLVTREGVFSVEAKHRNSKEDYEMIELYAPVWLATRDNPINNPFSQNLTHIKALREVIGEPNIFNMVVVNFCYKISGTASWLDESISKAFRNESDFLVRIDSASLSDGYRSFKKQIEGMPIKYTEEEVKQICLAIEPYVADKKARKAFKREIEDYNIMKQLEMERVQEQLRKDAIEEQKRLKAEQKKIAKEKKKMK